MKVLIIAAGLCGLALSILGAAGAHLMQGPAVEEAFQGVEKLLESGRWRQPDTLAWSSAMLFGFAHTLAALISTALPGRGSITTTIAGWAFVLGTVLFSFTIMAKEILLTRFLPAENPDGAIALYDKITVVTPVGGIAFMAGWILLTTGALLERPEADRSL
jgi:uncharacterized membrane protein YgdD (TMEM256/DUF423 family)